MFQVRIESNLHIAETKTLWKQQQAFRLAAESLMKALQQILLFLPDFEGSRVVAATAAYILEDDPWCTSTSNRLAIQILEQCKETELDYEQIGHHILSDIVKPVFECLRKKRVTSIGTLSKDRDHELESSFDTDDSKSWAVLRPEAATLVYFVLSREKVISFSSVANLQKLIEMSAEHSVYRQ